MEDTKVMTFKNDDEFILFAINITPIMYKNNDMNYYDFDYSDKYKDCLNNKICFKIEDEMSNIRKRKELNYRLIVKKIDNLL